LNGGFEANSLCENSILMNGPINLLGKTLQGFRISGGFAKVNGFPNKLSPAFLAEYFSHRLECPKSYGWSGIEYGSNGHP
jgi:hypothetical protein